MCFNRVGWDQIKSENEQVERRELKQRTFERG